MKDNLKDNQGQGSPKGQQQKDINPNFNKESRISEKPDSSGKQGPIVPKKQGWVSEDKKGPVSEKEEEIGYNEHEPVLSDEQE